MLKKTLLLSTKEVGIDLDSVEKMGYLAIQRPLSEGKSEVQLQGIFSLTGVRENAKSPEFYIFNFSKTADLEQLESLTLEIGKILLVEIFVSVDLSVDAIDKVYQICGSDNVFLTFPISFDGNKKYLDPTSANDIVQQLRTSGHSVNPRRDLCPPNLSIKNSRYVELGYSVESIPSHEAHSEFSIVIPHYENKAIAIHTLNNLSHIYAADPCFEVIVVDDGSFDGFIVDVKKKIDSFEMPLTLLSRPRESRRKMGDLNYGAGISRNIGAGFAKGEKILFLDCDILIAPDALAKLRVEMTRADLVMCQREHLGETESSRFPSYLQAMKLPKEESDYGYWKSFYEKASEWNNWDDKWRYVCTHSLCVRREIFFKVGGFANNYNVYGYEDVELGFRVAQLGGTFRLSENKVYHLAPKRERSEFFKAHYRKMTLLSYSSKIFYFNTLDRGVFSHTEHFWGSSKLIFVLYVVKKKLSKIPFLSKIL